MVKKSEFGFFVAIAWTLLFSGVAAANHEDGIEEKAGKSHEYYIWLSSSNAEEPFKRLRIQPLSAAETDMFIPRLETNLDEKEGDGTTRLSDGAKRDTRPDPSAGISANSSRAPTGFETSTHPLLDPKAGASPALLLIKEDTEEQKLYFGFLSFSLKW